MARTRKLTIPVCLLVVPLAPAATLTVVGQCHEEHDARALDADPFTAKEPIAPVLEGLGEHHHPVTTSSERAQMFFDQGVNLLFGFNHAEAIRSFETARSTFP